MAKNINQLKAGTALSYISMVLGYVISLIYTPIMLRLLGQSEYGLYNLVSSVVAYLGLLNFGMGSAYIRFYLRYKVNEEKENIAKLNGMFLMIFSAVAVIAVLGGSFLVFNAELVFGTQLTADELDTAQILMGIMVINTAISFPNIVFKSFITANERFIFQKLLDVLRIVANPFLVIPLLLMGFGSVGLAIGSTIILITMEVANIIFCFRNLNMHFSFKNYDFVVLKEVIIFSSYLFLSMVVNQINLNVDKFILGRIHGTVVVAVYGLATQLEQYYMSLSTAISGVFIPRVNKIVSTSNDNNILTKLFVRIGRIQFILLSMIASGLIFFGSPFIQMWAGEDYAGAYPVVLLLILSSTIALIQNIGIEIQQAKNMHQFRSVTYFIIAIVNVLITIPLATRYEATGAAFGTALSFILGNGLLMNWYYHKKVGLDIILFWKEIASFIPALIAPTIVGVIAMNLVDLHNLVFFLLFGLLYVSVFIFSIWKLGMNNYERDLIGVPVLRLLRRIGFIS